MTFGSFVGGAIGFVIGAYTGGPAGALRGWAIGSTIGGAVDPPAGPRLGEIARQTAQEGVPRPIFYGVSPPVSGTIIARSEPRRKKKRSGERVYRTYAIGFGEGPVPAFRRIWRRDVLVYDISGGLEETKAETGIVGTFLGQLLGSDENSAFLAKARLYLGTFDQMPDPALEAIFGVGTTPAHRGTPHIVVIDEDLTDSGGAIPPWTVQFASDATPQLSNDVLYPWKEGTEDPRDARNDHEYAYNLTNEGSWSATYSTLGAAVAAGNLASNVSPSIPVGAYQHLMGWSKRTVDVHKLSPAYAVDPGERTNLLLHYNRYEPENPGGVYLYQGFVTDPDGVVACGAFKNFSPPIGGPGSNRYWWGSEYEWTGGGGVQTINVSGVLCSGVYRLISGAVTAAPGEVSVNNCNNYAGSPVPRAVASLDAYIRVVRKPTGPEGYEYVSGLFKALQNYADATVGSDVFVTKYPLNPIVRSSDARYSDQPFWEAAYADAVADGKMEPFLVYGVDYPVTKSYAWKGRDVAIDTKISVADYVTDVCARANIPSISLDVSAIADLQMYGTMVTNQYDADEAVKAAAKVFFFDRVPIDGKLVFVPRGGNSVATITDDEMVEDERNEDSEQREDAIGVPRVLHLEYCDILGGIASSKQSTPPRVGDRRAVGEETIQSTIVMDADTAMRAAVINHKLKVEAQRGIVRRALPSKFGRLTLAENIIASVDGVNRRLRIQKADALEGLQQYELAHDRQSNYTSEVEGIPPAGQTPPPTSIVGATIIVPLDIPLVSDADDATGLGYYRALAGASAAWSGTDLETSRDDGANYTDAGSQTVAAVIGELTTSLGNHPQQYPDQVNTFGVRLLTPDSELAATDLLGMLNQTNLAAIGSPALGWELINFATPVEGDPGEWTIGLLLRGRKGTAAREHAAGEQFVLLDRAALEFVPASASDIGKTLTIRATTFGQEVEDGTVVAMPFTGQSQRERAAAYLTAYLDGSTLKPTWMGVCRTGGGGSAAQGAFFTGYRVTARDASTVLSFDTSASLLDIDVSGLAAPYFVSVQQNNSLTGLGPAVWWPADPNDASGAAGALPLLGLTHPFQEGGRFLSRTAYADAVAPAYVDLVRYGTPVYSIHKYPEGATSMDERTGSSSVGDLLMGLCRDPANPNYLYTVGHLGTQIGIVRKLDVGAMVMGDVLTNITLAVRGSDYTDVILISGELYAAHGSYIDVLSLDTLAINRTLTLSGAYASRFAVGGGTELWICDRVNGSLAGQLHKIDKADGTVLTTISTRRFPLGAVVYGANIFAYCLNNSVSPPSPTGIGIFKYRLSDGTHLGSWINAADTAAYSVADLTVWQDGTYMGVAWTGHKVFDLQSESYI